MARDLLGHTSTFLIQRSYRFRSQPNDLRGSDGHQPQERERLFGQHDHVRRYGLDYKDRLMEAGFSVTVDGFVRELDNRTVRRFGLMPDEDVYFCRKPAT